MENHYLVIEPYVHYNIKDDKAIFFNTLDNSFIITDNEIILRSLKNLKNGICKVKLTNELNHFINNLRSKYIGDILLINSKTPKFFTIGEKLNINDLNRMKNKESIPDVKGYISEVNIYLNTSCDLNCHFCYNGYKQFTCCKKSKNKNEMDFNLAVKILSELSSNTKLVLTGGNIFKYKELDKIVCKAKNTYKINNITIVSHINNIDIEDFNKAFFSLDTGLNISIIIDYDSLPKLLNDYLFLHNQFKKYNPSGLKLNFIVKSENELDKFSKIINNLNITEYIFTPYYNVVNLDFFEKFVFLNEEDILYDKQKIKIINIKNTININFFGKLFVFPSGELYGNLNNNPIGLLDENTSILFYAEELIKNRNAWFDVRVKPPCNNCIYQWLCPSISNYEYAIDRVNLCSVKN